MNKISCVLMAALLTFTTVALAEHHEAMEEKPSFHATNRMMMTAEVIAINHETRDVTVRGPEGNEVSFVASEEARNLGQVSVGDVIEAEYVESLSIEVIANEGFEPEAAEMAAMARSEEGEMPGMAAMDTRVLTAVVEEINLEANTFKLKGPEGNIQEYSARNPDNLRRAAVGDLVVITVTEAIAIVVEEKPAE